MYQNQNYRRVQPRRRRKLPIILGAVVVLGAIAVATWFAFGKSDPNTIQKAETPKTTQPVNSETGDISMLLTGDWIAHDSVNTAAKQGSSYDYTPLVSAFKPLFDKTDINFCNDPILNGGAALGVTGYPVFNSPTEFVDGMNKLGCNLVNTASNHSFDFTQANIDASVDAWAKQPDMLAVAGQNKTAAERDTVRYFTVKNTKFAILAYTTYSNNKPQNDYGVNVYSQQLAASQIAAAKTAGAQFIIVSMRWGVEYSTAVSPAQTKEAQFLADQGVHLVLGHGPHVLQPVEELKGASGSTTQVWYSLGNFLNTQIPANTLFNGVPLLTINPASKAISIQGFVPFLVHYEWTPAQAAGELTSERKNVKMYLLDDVTQQMIDAQQLKTTVAAEKDRMTTVLSSKGLRVPFLSGR